MKAFVTTGIVSDGKLKVRNQKAMLAAMEKFADCEVIVTIEKAHATRSHHQNALYWAGYIAPLCEYTGYSANEMHAYLKGRFLPKERIEIVDRRTGAVLDEQDLAALTTTTLNKIEFGEYLDAIEQFALKLGVTVGTNRENAA